MQKSLFYKYLQMTIIIILVSFIFLGFVVTVFITSYWNNERQEQLRQNAQGVANITAASLVSEKDNTFTINGQVLRTYISAFSENLDSYIIVTDVDGNIILEYSGTSAITADMINETYRGAANTNGAEQKSDQELSDKASGKNKDTQSTPTEELAPSTHISKDILSIVMKDDGYYGKGTLSGYFNTDCRVAGVPIHITNKKGEQTIIGAAFAASSSAMLSGYRAEIIKVFVLAALAALIVAFAISWLFSYKMTRPIRVMVEAIKCFGMGDYSVRVPKYSNDEIGELADAFNQMAESIANTETMDRNFIANISHELKTPMTSIAGFVDGIMDGTIPPSQQKHYLKIVSDEVKRLSRLVKAMLDLSKIDSGKMKLNKTRFEVNSIIFSTLLNFEDRIEEKHIDIRGLDNMGQLTVLGDPDMIHQIFYNLIENAVKFTNKGGTITINGRLEGGNKTVFSIINTGPGISQDDVRMIFDRFYKSDKSRSKDKTGVGLGLYIVKSVVQLHGGGIRCESEEGQYTLFEFWLPYSEPKKERRSTRTREREGTVEVVINGDDVDEAETVSEEPQREILDVTDYTVESVDEDDKRRN